MIVFSGVLQGLAGALATTSGLLIPAIVGHLTYERVSMKTCAVFVSPRFPHRSSFFIGCVGLNIVKVVLKQMRSFCFLFERY